jgi:glycosyltransferase involved in cell wall biosynthesis
MEISKKRSLVSIIMPCYNAEAFVKEAIFSMLNQTYQDLEILICDDASTDATKAIIDSFNDHRIRKFYHSQNLGYLLTCNELFQAVNGDFVTFQDADDYSEPGRIAACIEQFEADPDLGFITTDYRSISKSGKTMLFSSHPVDLKRFKSDSSYSISICGASIFIRQKVLSTIGFYHPFFARKGGEDYEWLFRIARQFKGVHIQEPLYVYRMYDSQVKLYNMRHGNIDSFIIHPAIEFIRKVWIERKLYLLEEENSFWLEEKVKQLEEPFYRDNSMFYRASAIEFLNLMDFKRSFFIALIAIRKRPLKFINYVYPFYILYLIFRRKVPFQLIPDSVRAKWRNKDE